MPLTIEIKDGRAVEPFVKLVRDRQIPTEDLIVTSFNDAIVEQVSRQAPEIPLAPGAGWTWKFFLRARFGLPLPRSSYVAIQVPHHAAGKDLHVLPEVVRRLLPSWLRLTVVTPRLLRAAHRAGLAVHVWTIDDENEMCELVDLGVDGIMTDRPSLLARVLERGP